MTDAEDDVVGPVSLAAAARVRMHLDRAEDATSRHDWWSAIAALETALDADPTHLDALDRLAEASLEAGDPRSAALAWEQWLTRSAPNPEVLVSLSGARLEACDPHSAAEAARRAVRLDPTRAEAHYALARALERIPDQKSAALRSILSAHHLDGEGFPLPIELSDAQWRSAAEQARQRVHPTIAALWDGVPVETRDWPTLDEARAADPPFPPTVNAIYRGTPPEDPNPEVRPEALVLFTRNLAHAGSIGDAIDDIADAMELEGMHWLALTPEDLEG